MALVLRQLGNTSTITVSTTALQLSTSTLSSVHIRQATHMMLFSTDKIRWKSVTDPGQFPTSTSGMFVAANAYLQLLDPNFDYSQILQNFWMIRDTGAGGDSTVEVALFKAT